MPVVLSPTSPIRDRKIVMEITPRYQAELARGFATADFEGQPEPETLQCRNELDRTNWLGLVLQCQLAIAVGAGDELIPAPGLRCTSNRMYRVTYSNALGRMVVLLGQAAAAQANWWRLKDLARSLPEAEDLEKINLEEGW